MKRSLLLCMSLALLLIVAVSFAQDRSFFPAPGDRGRCQPVRAAGTPPGGVAMSGAPVEAVDGAGAGEVRSAESDVIGGADSASVPAAPEQQGDLRAGLIDDNVLWDDFLLYRREALENQTFVFNDVDVSVRHIITVRDDDGLPVLGARVSVSDAQGSTLIQTRTLADGRTLFFPQQFGEAQDSYEVSVERDGVTEQFTLDNSGGQRAWDVTLDVPERQTFAVERPRVDVMFLIDTTGSMGDEIAQLQATLLDVSTQIAVLEGNPDVRFGMVTYKDRGDEYVTCIYDFTPDVAVFQADLNLVTAGGGGDKPESLNEGFYDAIHSVEWRTEETISLIFLITDAAPHLDYPDDYNYAVEMVEAAERGIRVHPIGSSGLELPEEYILRQIGQYTQGQFVFLTYAGGVPGTAGDERPDLSAGADPSNFTVAALDDVILELITRDITALQTP